MKKVIILFCTLVLTISVQAKEAPSKATFLPPIGFQVMAAEGIRIKYPNGNAPQYVVTSESTETTIAVDTRYRNLPQSELKAWSNELESSIKKVAQIRSNKIVQLAGQKWVQIEFISDAIGSKIYNILLTTGLKGKQMVVFNFNSSLKEFKRYEPDLRKSIQSITLK